MRVKALDLVVIEETSREGHPHFSKKIFCIKIRIKKNQKLFFEHDFFVRINDKFKKNCLQLET